MEGFRYECKLNNKIFSATFNVSDDTVTCIIPDNVSLFMYQFHHHNVTAAAINVYTECGVIIWRTDSAS